MVRALSLALFVAALAPLAGCGPKLQDVTGSVSLNGKPVADATVTFVGTEGTNPFSSVTDASGNFTITAVPTGEYKALVTKYPKFGGTAPSEDGKADKAYLDSMMKHADKNKGGPMVPMPGKGGKGMMMPPTAGGGSSVKSELPEQYASIEKTPLSVKVPAAGGVQLQLNSK